MREYGLSLRAGAEGECRVGKKMPDKASSQTGHYRLRCYILRDIDKAIMFGGYVLIILIAGGTHTGKTVFAQKLLEKYHYPYLSIDHLKMGLIRSGHCPLTPESDGASLTRYLWPIVREMIKTAIENRQNLIVEGCYIPADYARGFPQEYEQYIRYVCLVFSEKYIRERYAEIKEHACDIEYRKEDAALSREMLLRENRRNLELCGMYGLDYVLIDGDYDIPWEAR